MEGAGVRCQGYGERDQESGSGMTSKVMIKAIIYVILLVFVVGHDGDDGVVDEEPQGQDSCQAREGRPAKGSVKGGGEGAVESGL